MIYIGAFIVLTLRYGNYGNYGSYGNYGNGSYGNYKIKITMLFLAIFRAFSGFYGKIQVIFYKV